MPLVYGSYYRMKVELAGGASAKLFIGDATIPISGVGAGAYVPQAGTLMRYGAMLLKQDTRTIISDLLIDGIGINATQTINR
jgi:hypothetical protein